MDFAESRGTGTTRDVGGNDMGEERGILIALSSFCPLSVVNEFKLGDCSSSVKNLLATAPCYKVLPRSSSRDF